MKKYVTLIIAIVILIATAVYAESGNKMDEAVVREYFQTMLPTASDFEMITDTTARYTDESGSFGGYVGISSEVGYGGPVTVGTVVAADGAISEVQVVESKETPSYLKKITDKGFFKQFVGKSVGDSLTPGYDIECISGATLSSRAIGNSVSVAAHSIAESELGLKPTPPALDWQLGVAELAVALLFILGLVLSRVKRLGRFRLAFLVLSVVVLGFWLNRSLSIAQISGLMLGYLPLPQTNLIWYLVLAGALIPALVTGKNFYCTYICPFCGLQEVAHTISRTALPIGAKRLKYVRILRDVLLFAVIFIAFLSLNPSAATYEPFGTIFGLNGSSVGWYLVFFVLIVSFIFRRFWCTAFCPVGAFLDKLAMIGRDIRKLLRGKRTTADEPAGDRAEPHGEQIAVKDRTPVSRKLGRNDIIFFICYALILVFVILSIRASLIGVI